MAENVLLVREALKGFAASLSLGALEADELDTAVTEAANNVVRHAYEGQEGPLELELYALAGAIEAVVRDRGIGIRPHVGERTQPHTGIGLPMVHALTQRVAFSKLPGGGTEVRMSFAVPNLAPLDMNRSEPDIAGENDIAAAIEIALAPSTVARSVLPRVLAALAERADFSAQRVSDVRRLAEALAASAGNWIGGHLRVGIDVAPRTLQLRAGLLRAGSAASLLASRADGLGTLLERLAGDRRVESSDSAEMLALRLSERG